MGDTREEARGGVDAGGEDASEAEQDPAAPFWVHQSAPLVSPNGTPSPAENDGLGMEMKTALPSKSSI